MNEYPRYKVAALQAGPVYLNIDATIEKACGFIKEAARNGAKLIGFPEAFISGYPWWVWLSDAMYGVPYYKELLDNAITIGGEAIAKLSRCAQENHIYVCISGHEKEGGTVYMTQFWFDDNGNLLGRHRKMKATAAERRVWADGDGSMCQVYDTPLGKLGGLLCAEHHVPAYHVIIGSQGEQVHVASYPPLPVELTGTMGLKAPLAAVKSLCIENKAFGLFCTQIINQDVIDMLCQGKEELINKFPTAVSGYGGVGGGAACVINPVGEIISGDFLPPCEEGLVYGEVDLAETIPGKMLYDVYGNSKKGGCMNIVLNRKKEQPIRFIGEQPENGISFENLQSGAGGRMQANK